MPAHIKASLLGPSLTLPVRGGRLALGTWQGDLPVRAPRPRRARGRSLATLHRARRQRPLAAPARRGARFSANAVAPSLRVLGAEDGPAISPCRSHASASVQSARRGGCAWRRRPRAGRSAAIAAASSRAACDRPPGSASRLTMPIAYARSASIGSPVSASSIARWYGIRCGSRISAPPAATSPRLTSGIPKRASARRDDQVAGERDLEAAGDARSPRPRRSAACAAARCDDAGEAAVARRTAARRRRTPSGPSPRRTCRRRR